MIISQKKSEFEIQGQLASKEMTIGAGKDAKILGLLSNIYKNRFAFCVELISNSWDSHTESKCTDIPIEMNLIQNDSGEYVISFKDRGVGIDIERSEAMFSYGSSTKENNNEEIGSWGLGSKSPLAYTSQFQVDSVKDGVYRKWLVAKNERDIPQANLLIEMDLPDNENQTTVSVILKKEDVESKWSKDIDLTRPIFNFIREKTLYFDNLVYTGELEPLNDVKIVTYNNKYKIRDDVSYGELGFLLGQVYYRIDYKELEIDRVGIPCVFQVPLDAGVEPTPTREDVFYTESTKKYLVNKINEFKKWIQSYKDTRTHLKTYDEYLTKNRYNDPIYLENYQVVYRPNYSYPEKKLLEENFSEFKNYNEHNIIECFLKWEYDIKGGKKFSTKRKWYNLDFDRYLLKTDRASTVTDKYLKQQGDYQVFSKRTKKDIIYQLNRNLIKFRNHKSVKNKIFYRNNGYSVLQLIKAVARVVGMKINRYEKIVIPAATKQAILNPVRTRYVKGDDEVSIHLCRKHFNWSNYDAVFDRETQTITRLKRQKTTFYYSNDGDLVKKGWKFNNGQMRMKFIKLSKKDIKKIESLKNFKPVEELIIPVKWNKNFNKIVTNMLLKQFRSEYSFYFNQIGFIRKFSSTLADKLSELDNLYYKINRDKIDSSNFDSDYLFKEFMLQTIKLAKDNNHINLELWTKMETVKKQLDKLHVLTVFDLTDDNSVYYASNYIRKINKNFKLNTEHYQEEKITTLVNTMTELFKPQPILNLNSIL